MRAEYKWKLVLVVALAVLSVIVLIPSITGRLGVGGGLGVFNGKPIRPGLDLSGGMEIVLGPDYRLNASTLDAIQPTLLESISQAQVAAPSVAKAGVEEMGKYDGLKFTFASAADVERVVKSGMIKPNMTWRIGETDGHLLLKTVAEGNVLRVNVTQAASDFPEDAMLKAKTIIEDRVNKLGLSEPSISLDPNNNRINVQLPSVTDEQEAQKILQSTGRLNFRLNGKIVMYGDDLTSAKAGYDQGQVSIFFQLGKEGGKRFGQITKDNVGKELGMYLDEDELMTPIVNEPIPDGNGVIHMAQSTMEEAKRSAILMEAGSLPISLRNLSVNQVSPTLGKEVVRTSIIAGVIGLALVVVFMLGFYGLIGALADAALVLYAALVLVVMALMRGVLTLPGVAGLILSIGMAVDANIIIFERIKDELRAGKRMRPAVDSGFKRAFWTIFDSNLTTLIVAGVLLIYGSVAVRGFAVTLTIGIILSMFTALFVTRLFLEATIDKDPDKFAGHFRA